MGYYRPNNPFFNAFIQFIDPVILDSIFDSNLYFNMNLIGMISSF